MGLYLVQLSSEIKLRICTALGTTIYPNSPPSQTWSRIAEGTPILIIAPTRGRPVSGSDMGIGHGDQTWGSDTGIRRSRDLRTGGLGHLGRPGDVTAEAAVDAGNSVGQWWMILQIHMQRQGQRGWTRGMSATINGLGVACQNRRRSRHEG